MKKSLFLLPVLGLFAVSCTNNEFINDTDNSVNGTPGEVSGYLSVSLVAPGNIHTRAQGEDAIYQNGEYAENYVSRVRFYFFDEDGYPVPIRKNPNTENDYYSFYDWDPTKADNDNAPTGDSGDQSIDPDNDGNMTEDNGVYDNENPERPETVEKILSTTITLTGPEDYPKPTQVIAVVNPSEDVIKLTDSSVDTEVEYTVIGPSMSKLRAAVYDFYTNLHNADFSESNPTSSNQNFVMSNSVYATTDGNNPTGVFAQFIDEDKFGHTIAEAKKNPLIIYVERVLARLDLVMGMSASSIGDNIYETGFNFTPIDPTYGDDSDYTPPTSYENTPIYAKFLGWAITSTPNMSYLVKDINPGWPIELFDEANEPWNTGTLYHRSFWAINPEVVTNNPQTAYNWPSYTDLTDLGATEDYTKQNLDVFEMNQTRAYMQENADPEGTTLGENPRYPTKVIFAAQLVDAQGNPVTIAEYNGEYYTKEGLLNYAAHELDLYYQVGNTYKSITGDMLTFITHADFIDSDPIPEQGGYWVYFDLNEEAKGVTQWYHLTRHATGENPDDYEPVNLTDEKAMKNYIFEWLGRAMVWNTGYTYYYIDIRHLGATGYVGYHGVVRNHIYEATVQSLNGLGTPVWDPTERIFPVKPDRTGNQISAQIRILQWRLVKQSYDLNW